MTTPDDVRGLIERWRQAHRFYELEAAGNALAAALEANSSNSSNSCPPPAATGDEAIAAWLDARDCVGTVEAMMDAGDDLAAALRQRGEELANARRDGAEANAVARRAIEARNAIRAASMKTPEKLAAQVDVHLAHIHELQDACVVKSARVTELEQQLAATISPADLEAERESYRRTIASWKAEEDDWHKREKELEANVAAATARAEAAEAGERKAAIEKCERLATYYQSHGGVYSEAASMGCEDCASAIRGDLHFPDAGFITRPAPGGEGEGK